MDEQKMKKQVSECRIEIRGRVIEKKTGNGLKGLSVEPWAKVGTICQFPVTRVTTDKCGAFKLCLDSAQEELTDILQEGFAEAYFKVFHSKTLVACARYAWESLDPGREIAIPIDPKTGC